MNYILIIVCAGPCVLSPIPTVMGLYSTRMECESIRAEVIGKPGTYCQSVDDFERDQHTFWSKRPTP